MTPDQLRNWYTHDFDEYISRGFGKDVASLFDEFIKSALEVSELPYLEEILGPRFRSENS